MKIFRFALNIWITLVSMVSFLLGWAALAHSPKPVQASSKPSVVMSAPALPTLAPLQSLQSGGQNSNIPNFQVQIPSNNFNSAPPLFSTGGS